MTAVQTGTRAMLTQEYRDVADLLRTLTPQEWETETLCAGWRVRDVVAHVLYEATPPLRYVFEIVRSGGSMDRLNELYIRRGATKTTGELLAAFESIHGQGLGARVAPRNVLADLMIHHQDIRRPLARPRTVPADRLLTLLRHPDPFLRPGPRMRGLRFAATDVDWEHGTGPAVTGPGEAIFMAIAGRAVALADLHGPGVDTLRARLR
ncbi:maleylpyruvate isomerase family mycothiol-dependent enzyme [Nocardia vulneris]|uniref:maleylpyruvate isomerase family mycothiol-dependent enzyme n=1 Tax=Nocardia vulneris TaxID=1141657 RepID=UPI0030D1833C